MWIDCDSCRNLSLLVSNHVDKLTNKIDSNTDTDLELWVGITILIKLITTILQG